MALSARIGVRPALAYRADGDPAGTGYFTGEPPPGGTGGQVMAGAGGMYQQGQGVQIGQSAWHPTILYLGALIVAEMVVFGWISRVVK